MELEMLSRQVPGEGLHKPRVHPYYRGSVRSPSQGDVEEESLAARIDVEEEGVQGYSGASCLDLETW